MQRNTTLSANIVEIARFFRTEGNFRIAPQEEADVLNALEATNAFHAEADFKAVLKAIFVKNLSEQARFEEIFKKYMEKRKEAIEGKEKKVAQENPNQQKPKPKPEEKFNQLKDWLFGNHQSDKKPDVHATYSAQTTLTQKDFAEITDDELRDLEEVLRQIAERLARRQNRRFLPEKRGNLDLRRSLRKNVLNGGDLLHLCRKGRQKRRSELVLLCDVSQSMDMYSRFLIQFAYSFRQVFRRVEVFAFGTTLQHITPQFSENDFDKMLSKLSETVTDWSGGTKIGTCLSDFVENYSEKHLKSRTIVWIMSDGWDTGAPDVLENAMKKIHQRADKVIWLCPTAGYDQFAPNVAALKTALPYLYRLVSAHNADSLRKLGNLL
ncbi:MAG: hypothetical protein RLZZ628_945 [Bacteroidota bacterium]|jgi:uncharacterized protein with von Willebrand factor type A (vWA) domain